VSKSILPSISFSNTGNYSVVGYEPSIVQLVCSGDLAVISALSDGAVGVNINLSKYSLSDNAEEITVDLSKTTLSVPAGVSITNYIPSSIIVSLIKNR
jgi:hypothetical protein